MSSKVTLLGHQRHVPMVRQAVETWVVDPRAPVAVVTAGWEERENEDQELREHLARPCRNLAIWSRIEKLFQLDPELLEAMRWRHDRLRRVQELYRLRLSGLMGAARQLQAAQGDESLLQPERDGAILMLHGLVADFLFAGKVAGQAKPAATHFWLQEEKPFGHFARLCQAIEPMFLTGKAVYPVERTLLTSGVLSAAMKSLSSGHKQLETPHLVVRYAPPKEPQFARS